MDSIRNIRALRHNSTLFTIIPVDTLVITCEYSYVYKLEYARMITLAKLDIPQLDGSRLRVHFALQCDILERLVKLALTPDTQTATSRDASISVTIMQAEQLPPLDG